MVKRKCPECDSTHTSELPDTCHYPYHCDECGILFDDNDIKATFK